MKSISQTKKYQRTILFFGIAVALVFPTISFAAGTGIQDLLESAGRFLTMILPILIAVEFIIFLIGIMRFYMTPDTSSESFMSGNAFLVFGVISLFVTVAIFGLVAVLQNTVGVASGGNITAPQLNETYDAGAWGARLQ